MPELPEVQTIINELMPLVVDKKVTGIQFLRSNILQKPPDEINRLILGKTVKKISRKGKYILFKFDNQAFLIAHLKMTGKFVHTPSKTPIHVHDRLIFNLSDRNDLRFNDVRTLGKINVCSTGKEMEEIIGKIGIDPISAAFAGYDLYPALNIRKLPVKVFLMDAKNIAGIGNIYASEILYRSGISPQKNCNKISRKKAEELKENIIYVLTEALKHNGTTISDYRRVDSKTGKFQNFLNVYGKEGKACLNCGNTILRITQQQRSTYCCPNCQK